MVLLFLLYSAALFFFLRNFPDLSDNDHMLLRQALPMRFSDIRSKMSNIENIKLLFAVLQRHTQTHYAYVISSISFTYLLYQIFPLFLFWCPGVATALSILCGALLGFQRGFALVCLLATLGPSCAFLLFYVCGRPIVRFLFASKLDRLRKHTERMVANNNNTRGGVGGGGSSTDGDGSDGSSGGGIGGGGGAAADTILYIAVLRLTPVFPNFLINVASPVVGVKFWHFLTGTFLGLVPNTVILVLMGTSLMELSSLRSPVTAVVCISLLGLLLVLPKLTGYVTAPK
eukprot:GHVS01088447.1.p1 GENE.GHVS01088447.1~~GHVS01088447.1.p1  ORF type:complete len:333 (+),score=120.35 GHVS01088447.1:141-1001(+)